MKILYIAPCLPYPPDRGDRIRVFHHVRYLAGDHQVHLACLIDERPRMEHVQRLEELCASVHVVCMDRRVKKLRTALLFSAGAPLSTAAFHSRRFERRIAHELQSEPFDCILVYSSSMAGSVRHVTEVPKVVDFVDVESELWRSVADRHRFPTSWIYRRQADRLALREREIAGEFDVSIFVSEAEATSFRRRVADDSVAVVTNGVDLDFFAPLTENRNRLDSQVVVFIGTMSYEPNVDAVEHFCRDIFPLLKRHSHALSFSIVGRDPTRSVRRLTRDSRVTVTGAVPDVRSYLAMAGVMVAPFRLGRGIQNKILEAMAFGIPVVGTSLAFQGFPSTADAGVRVADEAEEFAHEVRALLEDPGWRRECAEKARQHVETHYRWDDHCAKLARILQDASEGTSVADYPASPR